MERVENHEDLKGPPLMEVRALEKSPNTIFELCSINIWRGYLLNSPSGDLVFDNCVGGTSWIYLYENWI
jgi:hypothetical protein